MLLINNWVTKYSAMSGNSALPPKNDRIRKLHVFNSSMAQYFFSCTLSQLYKYKDLIILNLLGDFHVCAYDTGSIQSFSFLFYCIVLYLWFLVCLIFASVMLLLFCILNPGTVEASWACAERLVPSVCGLVWNTQWRSDKLNLLFVIWTCNVMYGSPPY